jgi:hypothetical protein
MVFMENHVYKQLRFIQSIIGLFSLPIEPVIPKPASYAIFRTIRISFIFSTFLFSQGCGFHHSQKQGQVYYVRPSGNDSNSSLKIEQAWRTITKVNSVHFEPGDRILFEGGFTYAGTLSFKSDDSGTGENRLVLSSFGDTPAVIDGGDGGALAADSCDYLTVRKLAFKGSGRKNGNRADGVFITRSRFVEMDSLEIYGFQHSGLLLHICDNARITHVAAHDNGFAGIHVTGTTIWDTVRYDNHRLYIGHCIAENNPGDPSVTDNHSGSGIIASSVDKGTIEYCEAFGNGWDMPWNGNGPVGIWIWDSNDFIIQHCVSHDNKSAPDAADGGGFDFDGGVSNSILQYCLSYDNQGPGVGLFEFGAGKAWHDNTVRYNISRDDGKNGQGSVAIWKGEAGGTIRNCEIYNNTFTNSNPNGPSLCIQNNWEGFNFRNNIFVYNGTFLMQGKKLKNERFENNCYWNLAGRADFMDCPSLKAWGEKTGNEMMQGRFTGIYADPGLKNTGKTKLISPLFLKGDSLDGYKPDRDSPLIDAGLDLEKLYGFNPGNHDLSGNPIPQGKAFDIGAVERTEATNP